MPLGEASILIAVSNPTNSDAPEFAVRFLRC